MIAIPLTQERLITIIKSLNKKAEDGTIEDVELLLLDACIRIKCLEINEKI